MSEMSIHEKLDCLFGTVIMCIGQNKVEVCAIWIVFVCFQKLKLILLFNREYYYWLRLSCDLQKNLNLDVNFPKNVKVLFSKKA